MLNVESETFQKWVIKRERNHIALNVLKLFLDSAKKFQKPKWRVVGEEKGWFEVCLPFTDPVVQNYLGIEPQMVLFPDLRDCFVTSYEIQGSVTYVQIRWNYLLLQTFVDKCKQSLQVQIGE